MIENKYRDLGYWYKTQLLKKDDTYYVSIEIYYNDDKVDTFENIDIPFVVLEDDIINDMIKSHMREKKLTELGL